MNRKSKHFDGCPRHFYPVAGLAVAVAALSSGGAQAQEWRLEPEVRLAGEYDDNARLRTEEALIEKIDGFIAEGTLGIGYITERSSLRFTPKLRSRVYNETPDVDSDDQFADLDYDYEGLKSKFQFRSSYEREAARTAERANADVGTDDPDQIPTDPTGIVFTNARRQRISASPQWTYDLTERTTIGASYTYLDVTYDEAVGTFLKDYRDQHVEGRLGRHLTERTLGYLSLRGRKYENDTGINDANGKAAVLGLQSELSETMSLQAEIGYENTENQETGVSDSSVVGNLNLVQKMETITLLAQYRRDVAAGGSGRVSARDSLNFNVDKQFTERFSAGLGLRAYTTDGIGDQAVTVEERDQYQVRAEVEVALSRAFSIEGEYNYTRLRRSNVEGEADSNNVLVWLVYRPTPIIN